MGVVGRSWQPMIEALSKRLCIITRDMTDLQLFCTGSKCPKNNRHSARCSVIQVCLIVKLAYVAEPQLFKRSGRSNHYRAIKISWGRHYRKIILQSYFSLPTRLLYGHLCYGKFSGTWSRRILHKFSIK